MWELVMLFAVACRAGNDNVGDSIAPALAERDVMICMPGTPASSKYGFAVKALSFLASIEFLEFSECMFPARFALERSTIAAICARSYFPSLCMRVLPGVFAVLFSILCIPLPALLKFPLQVFWGR